jgi:glucuronate isomerase
MKGRLFLIHWHAEEAEEYADRLRAEGWQVNIESEEGGQAHKRVLADVPDAVLIYLTRSPSHGRQTADAIRASKAGRKLPIVFVGGKDKAVEKTKAKLPDALFITSAELGQALDDVARRKRPPLFLPQDRYFDPDRRQKEIARHLYARVADLPLVCPHGHVDPRMFADEDYSFGSPVDLLIIPDHYVFRMLYSQGISLERLGIPRLDGAEVETDHRAIWQTFAENFYLFRGTPTGMWLAHELHAVFGVEDKLTGESAQDIYDHIAACLEAPEFRPRRLFERFNIEVLCTTDAATDPLEHHRAIRQSGWGGRVVPTFRPDAVVNLYTPGWAEAIQALSQASGVEITAYRTYIQALENRRAYFKDMGATATDHSALTPYTEELSEAEAEAIFQRALQGEADTDDARRFTGHMLIEMARMSLEDGLVMQLHPGSYRNHNPVLLEHFGRDMGADIPIQTEYTYNLWPLLNKYGNDPRLTLILFTLDETTYSRELAPLAGHYPSLKLGPPWWFHDSLQGMLRYRQQVIETAGLYNTVGFNDDTRAFPSIPARHDLWRRVDANWLAGLVVRGIVDMLDAENMIYASAYQLARQAYKLDQPT